MNEVNEIEYEVPEDDIAHQDSAGLIFTDERMAELKREVGSGDYARYNDVMARLITDLRPYAEYRISLQLSSFYGGSGWSREQLEDAFQEVCLELHKSIAAFLVYDDRADNTRVRTYQRQRWLRQLIWGTVRDWLDEESFGESRHTRRKNAAAGKPSSAVVSLEAGMENGFEPGYDPIEALVDAGSSDVLDSLIRQVCSLRVGPEAMLGFLYHSVVFYLLGDSEKKSRPEKTAEFLNRFTLGQLRELLPGELAAASGFTPTPGVFDGLDRKLKGHEHQRYRYEAAKLSVSASYIRRRLQGSRE